MKRDKRRKFKKIDFKLSHRFFLNVSLWLIFLGLVFYLGNLAYNSDLFRIRDIKSDIELNNNLKNDIMGKSLFTFNTQELYLKLTKKNNSNYEEIRIFKEFPSSLKIEAKKREFFVQLKKGKFFPLDRKGFILTEGTNVPFSNIIIVEIEDIKNNLGKGGIIKDERMDAAFHLIEEIHRRDFIDKLIVSSVNATALDSLCFIVGDAKIIVGRGDFERKLHIFEKLSETKLKDGFSSVNYIDLRYKKVYIGYKKL